MALEATYKLNDLYFDSVAKVLYICTTAGTKSTSVWKAISGGAPVKYTFVSDGGDSWVCTPVAGGSNVNITKPPELKTSLTSNTIEGVNYNYSYTPIVSGSTTIGYRRTVSYSGAVEVQEVVPPMIPNTTIIDALNGEDMNRAGRAWSEI